MSAQTAEKGAFLLSNTWCRAVDVLRRRVWLLCFAAFFLIGSAWAMAAPYEAYPDEVSHVMRAAAVVTGQVSPVLASGHGATGAYETIPVGLNPPDIYCMVYRPETTGACLPQIGKDGWSKTRREISGAGRYNPLYYGIVGWPLRWRPDMLGIILVRLISAALSAAFLASAAVSCLSMRRPALAMAGLLLAVTPVVTELAGAVNPNGLEAAVAVSFWAALIPLLLGGSNEPIPVLARRAGIAAVFLGQLRFLSPLWLVAFPAVLLVPPARERLRAVIRSWPVRSWAAAAVVSGVLGLAWTIHFKASEIGKYAPAQHFTFRQAVQYLLDQRIVFDTFQQGIDGLGQLETHPPAVQQAWMLGLGVLLISALAFGGWIDRWRIATLSAGTLLVAIVPPALIVNTYGFSTYGRYFLAILVGFPLLAAFVVANSDAISVHRQVQVSRVCVLLALGGQFVSLVHMMVRWQIGLAPRRSINPLHGKWHPLPGSALPLLAMIGGLVILGVLAWRVRDKQPAPFAPAESVVGLK